MSSHPIRVCYPSGKMRPPLASHNFFDVYTSPWITDPCHAGPIFNNNPEFFSNTTFYRTVVVGGLPYHWSAKQRRSIDGFTHIVVDKYLYQSCMPPLVVASKNSINRIVGRIYADFRPATVLVNNHTMAQDFSDYFSKHMSDVNVDVIYHPISDYALGMQKRFARQSSSNPLVLFYDSGAPLTWLEEYGDLGSKCIEKICQMPYTLDTTDKLEYCQCVGLLNLREEITHVRDKIDLFRILRMQINRLTSSVKSANQDTFITSTINNRWKPSTKASASVGMNLPYIGMPETSNLDLLKHFDWPHVLISSLDDLCYLFEDDHALRALYSKASKMPRNYKEKIDSAIKRAVLA